MKGHSHLIQLYSTAGPAMRKQAHDKSICQARRDLRASRILHVYCSKGVLASASRVSNGAQGACIGTGWIVRIICHINPNCLLLSVLLWLPASTIYLIIIVCHRARLFLFWAILQFALYIYIRMQPAVLVHTHTYTIGPSYTVRARTAVFSVHLGPSVILCMPVEMGLY